MSVSTINSVIFNSRTVRVNVFQAETLAEISKDHPFENCRVTDCWIKDLQDKGHRGFAD